MLSLWLETTARGGGHRAQGWRAARLDSVPVPGQKRQRAGLNRTVRCCAPWSRQVTLFPTTAWPIAFADAPMNR